MAAIAAILVSGLCGMGLAGCGQKGPLILPGAAPAATAVPVPTAASAAR